MVQLTHDVNDAGNVTVCDVLLQFHRSSINQSVYHLTTAEEISIRTMDIECGLEKLTVLV